MFDTFTQKFPRDYTAAYTIVARSVEQKEFPASNGIFLNYFKIPQFALPFRHHYNLCNDKVPSLSALWTR